MKHKLQETYERMFGSLNEEKMTKKYVLTALKKGGVDVRKQGIDIFPMKMKYGAIISIHGTVDGMNASVDIHLGKDGKYTGEYVPYAKLGNNRPYIKFKGLEPEPDSIVKVVKAALSGKKVKLG